MRSVRAIGVLCALALGMGSAARAAPAGPEPAGELGQLAEDAYIYGYPLMLQDETRRQLTGVAAPEGVKAPVNQLAHLDQAPGPGPFPVVRPNLDTVYMSAFLDVSAGPVVLHVPDTQGRYYLAQLMDAYTNVFAAPGSRTLGEGTHDVAVVGPGWKGTLPSNLEHVTAPTNDVWLIGRVEIQGDGDRPRAARLARGFTLTPLQALGTAYTPPRNLAARPAPAVEVRPPERVASLDEATYFRRLAMLLDRNPPPARDRTALARFARLGLEPGRFAPSDEADLAIKGAGQRALARIGQAARTMGVPRRGWRTQLDLGSYGIRYLDRAAVALSALGANLPADAVYAMLDTDEHGQGLSGKRSYVLHFRPGQLPPVNAFWSLTLYDPRGYLPDHSLHRHAIGHGGGLLRNPDGSVDIFIQPARPRGRRAINWLPAPDAAFNLTLRMYGPKERVLNGQWMPPAVRTVVSASG
jgi:hypothetical protein